MTCMETRQMLIIEDDDAVDVVDVDLHAARPLSLRRSAILQKSAHLDGFLMKYYGNLDSDWIE
ncbi:hypothetical protein D3Z09_08060 [Rahnella aquatilis]|nr:hypothetical protein D3Z09_08060 [Rahnella aquatilis]AZP50562.1 hypothetical protein EJP80_08545 [Rahnella aquatilis]